jgi:hypothetical protein
MVRRGGIGLAALAALAACGGGRPRAPVAASADGSDITLYRDAALVQQRVALEVPAGGSATVRVRIPAGLGVGDVRVVPRAGVEVTEVRVASPPAAKARAPRHKRIEVELEVDVTDVLTEGTSATLSDEPTGRPLELELVARAAPGRASIRLGYVTNRLAWEVAYTMTASPARDRAELRGAIAIRNTTGIELPGAQVRLVDATIADARTRAADAVAWQFTRKKPPASPAAPPRELGLLDVADGETRAELLREPIARPMRSVLVYDPIGTQYDRNGTNPATEADLGVRPPPGPRVDESFEIDRDPALSAGLPAGPVRLLERRTDGSLALLGEARLFEATASGAATDTISVGTADHVTGQRERRELTVDNPRKRVVEEFLITIDNERPRPVEVLVREHLYRGLNWTLAYISVPAGDEAKEGPQQVAPRITVPPKSKGRVMYAVVYWW